MTFSNEEKIDGLCMITDALLLKKIVSYSLSATGAIVRRVSLIVSAKIALNYWGWCAKLNDPCDTEKQTKMRPVSHGRPLLYVLIFRVKQVVRQLAVSIFCKRMSTYLVACKRDVILLFLLSKSPRVWQ